MYLALMLSACVPLTTVYPTDCNLVFSSWARTSKICRGNWNKKEDTLYLKRLNMCFQLIAVGFAVILYV